MTFTPKGSRPTPKPSPDEHPQHVERSGTLDDLDLDTIHHELSLDEVEELETFEDDCQELRWAEKTVKNYKYWSGRFDRWLRNPTERFRGTNGRPRSLDELLPWNEEADRLFCLWLLDISAGPRDPDAQEIWTADGGCIEPGTFNNIISAMKWKLTRLLGTKWAPSEKLSDILKGLRRKLEANYRVQRAEPLLLTHVDQICSHLANTKTLESARDRLVLELHALGIANGALARITLDCVIYTATGDAAPDIHCTANSKSLHALDLPAIRSLVIPGQLRRGGNRDASRTVDLAAHPDLATALDDYLDQREVGDMTDPLIELTRSNPHKHVRQILDRLAEIAQIEPTFDSDQSTFAEAIAKMRAAHDKGDDWPGQLQRQRNRLMVKIGYLCALRRSELCALRIRDIELDYDGGRIEVHIRKSKTDQHGEGATIGLGGTDERYDQLLCEVREWLHKLFERGAAEDTPLFPAFSGRGNILLTRSGGHRPLSAEAWNTELKAMARAAKVFDAEATPSSAAASKQWARPRTARELEYENARREQRYDCVSGHSLRRGLITNAILNGTPPLRLAALTRHKNVQELLTYADTLTLAKKSDLSAIHYGPQGNNPARDRSSAAPGSDEAA